MDVHGLLNHLTIYWRKKGQQALLWFGGINNSKHERSSNKHLPIAKQSKIKKENKLKIGSNSGPVVFALFSSLPPRSLGSWFAALASHCPLSVEGGSKSGRDDLGLSQRLLSGQSSSIFQRCFSKSSSIGLIIKEVKASRNHLKTCPCRHCFDLRHIIMFAPAGVEWAMADVCEVLAVARIDPATYGVLSQAGKISGQKNTPNSQMRTNCGGIHTSMSW